MNWLDRVISAIAPEAGLRRAEARHRLVALSSYEGARRSRPYEGWTAITADANEELRFDIATLRNRARDLVRNTPHAANAVRMLTTQLVGTGIIPLISGDKAQDFQDAWRWFCDSADFEGDTDYYGLQALAAQTMVESGEALILYKPAQSTLRLKVPLQLQVLEPDYIDTEKNEKDLRGGGFIVAGIEFNSSGKKVAYWLFDRHPGDGTARLVSKRVPAGEVIHLFRKDRAGAVRAAPWLAPIMVKARDIADYDQAELLAKKIQACTTEFVTLTEPNAHLGTQETDASTGERVEKMQIGKRVYLRPGESVQLNAPPIVPGYADYSRKNLHDMAAGVGMTYEMLTGDLSQVNYSSYRAGHIFFNETFERYRWHTIVPKLCVAPWGRFAKAADAAGLIKGDPARLNWMPPPFQSIDPLKDYKATLVAVRAGFKSLRQAIGEQGYDAEEILNDIQEMNKMLDERQLVQDSDPRKSDGSGSLQQQDATANQGNGQNEIQPA